ncbi:MAG TPA: ABC transporter permease [Gemmatimonadaceae bacterium]
MRTGMSWLDVKLGLRMLAKHPALSLVGGLGMAVGIAVSVGFFAFAVNMVYPDIPLEEGDRIVALENRDIEIDNEERRSLHDFVLWRDELTSVRDLGAFRNVGRNLVLGDAPPELVQSAEMTASGFRVSRVPPLLGRYLLEDDERPGAPPVVVIGHDVWRSRFGGDSGIVGREIRFGRVSHTVVGVMPEGYAFPMSHQYWTPLRADPAAYPRREGPSIFIFGRLAPGATMAEAQAELEAIGRRTAAEFPASNATLRPMVMPYTHSLTDIQGLSAWAVVQMQLMMSLLLVVVALNVAVLVYARTATRQGEIAVRTAMGASRRRIVAQLFAEALVLALLSAALGLGIAQVGVELGNRIMAMESAAVPFWMDYSLQPTTVLYTVGLAVLAAVIVGVLPALQVTGRSLQTSLRQLGGGTGIRLGKTWSTLVVAQVAIAVAALPAAVNMGWEEIRHATTRPRYAAQDYMMVPLRPELAADAELAAPGTEPRADTARFGDRLVEVIRRLEAEPGVADVSYSANVPGPIGRVEVEGAANPEETPGGHRAYPEGVAPDYLALYGAPILAGRGLAAGDLGPEATAVVVNEAFVRQVLGGADALGRRVRYVPNDRRARAGEAKPSRWYEIVGVAADLEANELDPDLVTPRLYHPVGPAQAEDAFIEARLRGATAADVAARLREIALEVDASLRLGMARTVDELERQDRLAVRLVALAIGLVLLSVFLLSAAGVYALTSVAVTKRRKEIGIRVALGALPRQVLRSIFARVARQVALGLALGVGAAALFEGASGGELLGGRGTVLLPAFALLMTIVALLAALGPARRGLAIEPTEALRAE